MISGAPPNNGYRQACSLFMSLGGIALLVGTVEVVVIGGNQVLAWLQQGVWHPLRVVDGLNWLAIFEPTSSWVGVQRMIDWTLNQTLAGALFLLAVAVGMVFVIIGAVAEKGALRIEREWRDAKWQQQVASRPLR